MSDDKHLTIPGALEWDSGSVERFTIATLRYAVGSEHDVRYVSERDYDAALAREAALREELAALRESYEAMRDRKNSIVDLQQRLTVAERRNVALEAALKFYADGDHLLLADADAWDTCSGEPINFLHDEAGTASVEDGSIAKAALKPAAEGEGS